MVSSWIRPCFRRTTLPSRRSMAGTMIIVAVFLSFTPTRPSGGWGCRGDCGARHGSGASAPRTPVVRSRIGRFRIHSRSGARPLSDEAHEVFDHPQAHVLALLGMELRTQDVV